MTANNKPKYHLINELPHIYELEDMMEFCKRIKKCYIYGHGENQEYLLKYLEMCGVRADGYVTSWKEDTQKECYIYKEMPVLTVEAAVKEEGAGIILALPDRYYNYVIPKLRELGFTDYFLMSEFNKRAIACQVKPRTKDLMTFEVSIVDHCNLSCQMCDHYSQLSDKWFVDMEQYEKDMIQMGKLFQNQMAAVSLLGGEPTLHPELGRCIEIARREFPEDLGTEIIILTNGIKLLELEHAEYGNIWEICRRCNVHITVTVYPVKQNYEALEKKAEEYGVSLSMSSDVHSKKNTKIVKISDKHTMDLRGRVEKFYCVHCLYFNKFNVLKDGRLYMCPVQAHSNIFNKAFDQKLELRKGDYLDIYKLDRWEEIAEFSSSYVPFCSYCDLKHWGHHGPWKPSKKELSEYV